MKQFLGVSFLCIGTALQQYATYQRAHFKLPHREDLRRNVSLALVTGVCCEALAIILLPLYTYILLSSCHYIVFTYSMASREGRALSSYEISGTIVIVLGYILITLNGGTQEAFTLNEFLSLASTSYLMWMISSLFINLSLRRMGFYAGKRMFESCVPGQLSTFGLGGLKTAYYCAELYVQGAPFYIELFLISGFVGCTSLLISGSFLKLLFQVHDSSIVLGTYYLWNTVYSLPLSVYMLRAGVAMNPSIYLSISLSYILVFAGTSSIVYSHSLLKDSSCSDHPTPQAKELSQIHLNIENEALIEAESIDEEALIQNIKNV